MPRKTLTTADGTMLVTVTRDAETRVVDLVTRSWGKGQI